MGRSNVKLSHKLYVLYYSILSLNFKYVNLLVIIIWLMTQLLLKIMKTMRCN